MTITEETKQTTENPYTIRKLTGKWIVALLLMLLVFPFLAEILESFVPWLPGSLIYPGVAGWYFIYMVVWTVRFFLKKKQFGR